MTSLQESDREAAAVAKAPRVSLKDIERQINGVHFFTAAAAIGLKGGGHSPLHVLTISVIEMTNGFTVVGASAPASPENFDAELGKKLAYEDAIRQLWRLMGFALRDKLAKET
jgi:hypothetical protein